MIKRMNKVTSLLVAAAAMVSIVPANASTKLDIKEGTIERAIAFEGGNYVFEGYKKDEDNNGIYFNNGSKDSLLEDIENVDQDGLFTFGTKYVVAEDGNDQYMIDMSTGKVSDEDTKADLEATLKTRLNSSLRKTERYEDAGNEPVESLNIVSERFAETWYEYTATTSATTSAAVYGYTNQSGKYIDANVTANVYVANGSKSVKIEEFGDKEGTVTAKLNTAVKPLTIATDANYIYRIVSVLVSTDSGANYTSELYLQKISKAQGDKEKQAYLPKSVESYLLFDDSRNNDAQKAFNILNAEVKNDEIVIGTSVRVVDGALYCVNFDNEEVKVNKLTLKRNEKVKISDAKDETVKVDYSLVKYADDVDTDADDISIDVDGNVWAIYNGKISKSVKGGKFEVVYTCDRSLDRISVYNEKSLIAWDESGEVYTTVQEGKEVVKDDVTNEVVDTVKTGWQSENGTWYLYDAAGTKLTGWQLVNGTWYYMDPTTAAMRTGWVSVNGAWYFMQASGAMKTGWLLDGSTWYYMQASGAMATGWLNDNGTWYYLNANGSMAANTTVGGYVLGANGAWIR